jgi:hypothetical protein
MSPGEGEGNGGGGDEGGGSGSGGGGGDISAILEYLYHINFGTDGDYTGNGGYGGDNIGPPGSKEPEKDVDRSRDLLDVLMAPPGNIPGARDNRPQRPQRIDAYGRIEQPEGAFFHYLGTEVDVYSGLRPGLEQPDPFTGVPPSDPLMDVERPARWWSAAPFPALRQRSLLSSPDLIAENDKIPCDPNRTTCMPELKSDVNQSSLFNEIQADWNPYNAAIKPVLEGKVKIITLPAVDVQKLASNAAEVSRSDEYKLGFAVNQLRDHPLEIRHSAVLTGLGHMAVGGGLAVGSGAIIYFSGGLLLPLGGAMGLATGTAQFFSGAALAVSGADSMETVRMSGQLDYVFALTASPARLMFGTTGLVLSGGDMDVSHRFALVGGVAEDLMTFRGDPSKLYSAVVPGVGTKAEKGAAALLMKDVAALGFRARAESVEQVAAKLNRNFTVEDLQAIAAFREQLATTGRLDLAGVSGHAAGGAAGGSGGVDFVKYGGAFQQELKLHGPNTWIASWYLDKAATQSLNYSIKYQLETRALGEQLVPIRSVKHIWISPTEAVKYVK